MSTQFLKNRPEKTLIDSDSYLEAGIIPCPKFFGFSAQLDNNLEVY
jgi:hypothetical protein